MRKRIFAAGLAVGAALISHSALAWNDLGHKVIAIVADRYLSDAARARVRMMLQTDNDSLTAHDFVSEATWADKYRANDPTHRTEEWHFADIDAARPNIPTACFGQPSLPQDTPASQGPAKDCVIDKVNQFAAELADPKVGDGERLLALKYLLNLVGDLHQPLNVSIEEGNNHGMAEQVEARTVTPGDLYHYWDEAFVYELGSDPQNVAQGLITHISATDQTQWATAAPQLWALEAHQLGIIRGYGVLSEGNDHAYAKLTDEYVHNAVQTVATQLSRAGVRLAYVINEALAPEEPAIPRQNAKMGDRASGRGYALGRCSVCHVVDPEQSREANLAALAPDFQAIANTRGMTDTALREFLSGSHPTMPTLELTPKQTNDVVAYILSLKRAAERASHK